MKNNFRREERIKSKKLIDYVFNGGARSFSNFPIRIVYKENNKPSKGSRASILVSVSKKRFKHATDRNKVKRLIREAYRTSKSNLLTTLNLENKNIAIAFIYLSNKIVPYNIIQEKIQTLLSLIIEDYYNDQKDID